MFLVVNRVLAMVVNVKDGRDINFPKDSELIQGQLTLCHCPAVLSPGALGDSSDLFWEC